MNSLLLPWYFLLIYTLMPFSPLTLSFSKCNRCINTVPILRFAMDECNSQTDLPEGSVLCEMDDDSDSMTELIDDNGRPVQPGGQGSSRSFSDKRKDKGQHCIKCELYLLFAFYLLDILWYCY